ncbi:MAG: serine/threonine-protein phosphatase [Ruminococcus sp.]|nr:serine/threonine-protein phosphatase [Ruminococcus sp.]
MYYCCGITEKGNMPHNEDAMLIGKNAAVSGTVEQKLEAPFIAAVSDGVSGELSGELASKMCMELIRDIKYSGKINLKQKLAEVHRKMAQCGSENKDNHNMQATLCAIAVNENGGIQIINVGDSRLYRFRGGRLRQISRDQSLVQLLFEEGTITQEELRTHVHRNIIFPVLGNISAEPQIDILPLEGGMKYGDILLLCTDGLSDYLSPLDIEEILELPKSLPKRLEMLVKKALEKDCADNITVVAVVYC